MPLQEYKRKRDFSKSMEPSGARALSTAGSRFVVQKHAASRLHYDFRLEVDGTLRSWAVPKGIPLIKGEKRLAVQVEDHPVSYADFEGTIPKGQYGGGTVLLWDTGAYTSLSGSPHRSLRAGKLHFELTGRKLRGEWHLVRLQDESQWLLIRTGETMTLPKGLGDDRSVRSGRTMRQISLGNAPSSAKPVKAANPPKPRKLRAPEPALGFIEPMKAKTVVSPPAGEWLYEVKFDGYRALALKQKGHLALRSRNNLDLSGDFPEICAALAQLQSRDFVIDGEIVAFDKLGHPSFQVLQSCLRSPSRPPIVYYAFDLLWQDGRDLRQQPLEERKQRLAELFKEAEAPLLNSPSLEGEVDELLAHARKLGLEGLVGKRAGSRYESGPRSGAWIKLRLDFQQEMVIGGYTDPAGQREYFGALLVGVHEREKLRFAGKVGTGFDEETQRLLFGRLMSLGVKRCPFEKLSAGEEDRITAAEMLKWHWVRPRLVCQVRFSEWTRDGKLRHPVFLGLRADKRPGQVVREYPETP